MAKELTKLAQTQINHAKRSDVVFDHLFDRIQDLEEAMQELVNEVSRGNPQSPAAKLLAKLGLGKNT